MDVASNGRNKNNPEVNFVLLRPQTRESAETQKIDLFSFLGKQSSANRWLGVVESTQPNEPEQINTIGCHYPNLHNLRSRA